MSVVVTRVPLSPGEEETFVVFACTAPSARVDERWEGRVYQGKEGTILDGFWRAVERREIPDLPPPDDLVWAYRPGVTLDGGPVVGLNYRQWMHCRVGADWGDPLPSEEREGEQAVGA